MNRYSAKIISVDSKDLLFDVYLGFDVSITIDARLSGIEILAEQTENAKRFIKDWFDRYEFVIIEYDRFEEDQDTPGVWPVTVMCNDPLFTKTLNETLVDQGLARKPVE